MWIVDARIQPSLMVANGAGLPVDRSPEGLIRCDLKIADGRIADIVPPGSAPSGDGTPRIDQRGGQVWPALIDAHTHLDKGHIWPRTPNPDGSFMGALESVTADREASWTAEDVAARMEFSLKAACAHGTAAIRTHLDSQGKQTAISWAVFDAMRREWAGRIDLQAVSLSGIDTFKTDEAVGIADTVADHGGVLGAVTYMVDGVEAAIGRVFDLAEERGLDLDFHVDETLDVGAITLNMIAGEAIRRDWVGRGRKLLVGHCCSLATREEALALATLDQVAQAGIAMVSLPMCNLYLQDRSPNRTPRQRGVTLLHEAAARGIPVAVASDNTRDPFYAYGDLDLVEVYREATRIAHLDHPVGAWPRAVAKTPAEILGLGDRGVIAPGAPADLILFSARNLTELLARPQADRRVLRGGVEIDTTPPDYRDLDPLFASS